MSSVTTAVVAAADEVAVVVPATVEKAPRRFPPPCWTQEETVALIGAYRERWYALRRGYLRTADWDAVAAAVADRFPGASPAKTSAQCRHKMEKLRQRYRAEKQRALAFPSAAGRYLSSWFFFENMEAMENGTTPQTTSVQKPDNSSDGSQLKSLVDQNLFKIKLKAKDNPESSPDLGFDNVVQADRFNSAAKIPIEYSSYLNMQVADKDDEDFINRGMMNQMNRISVPIQVPPLKSRSKKTGKLLNNFNVGTGFHHHHQQQQQILPPGVRINRSDYNRSNPNEDFFVKIPNNNNDNRSNFSDPAHRAKYSANLNPNSANHGSKRRRNAVEEIVASINLLAEGFVRMEKEKMEMAREMEAMRMEMEMKRNQMLLESQKQIVDAFLKGLFELKKNKKVKSGVAPDSAEAS